MAKWFYTIDGQPAGPVDSAALKQLATTGRLKTTDKVRREDMAEWFEAKLVKGLVTIATVASSSGEISAQTPPLKPGATRRLVTDDAAATRNEKGNAAVTAAE